MRDIVRRCVSLILALNGACVIVLLPALAWACGAFVPSMKVPGEDPIVHDSERMLYVVGDDGQLTVYQGRSFESDVEEFAWILPVPGEPTVELAPEDIFDKLADATFPRFEMEDRSDGNCPAKVAETIGGTRGADPGRERSGSRSPVRQVAAGRVGPFDHTTIATGEDVERPGQAAMSWLEANGYDLGSVDRDVLRSYLEQGLNLLAFRLRHDTDTDEVRPVEITVEADQAFSPMRLAAAGADDATDVVVWVAANHPVVPEGYAHISIDQALIHWHRGGRNYQEVVAKAVREVGGQGFVTDSSMKTSELRELLLAEEEGRRWKQILEADDDTPQQRRQILEAVVALEMFSDRISERQREAKADRRSRLSTAGRDRKTAEERYLARRRGMTDSRERHRTRRDAHFDATDEIEEIWSDFVPGPNYEQEYTKPYATWVSELSEEQLSAIDVPGLIERIDDEIVAPRMRFERRMDSAQVITRLSTTMAPEDMTRDVGFVEDPEASLVAPERSATRLIDCGSERESGWNRTRSWRFVPPEGTAVDGRGAKWPVTFSDLDAAYSVKPAQDSTTERSDDLDAQGDGDE